MQSASETLRNTKCYGVRDVNEADIFDSQRPAEVAIRRLCMKYEPMNLYFLFKSDFPALNHPLNVSLSFVNNYLKNKRKE